MAKNVLIKNKIKLVILLLGLLMILLYRISNRIEGMSLWIYNKITAPFHRVIATVCDKIAFSVAELLIGIFAIGFIAYTIYILVHIFFYRSVISDIVSWLVSCIMLFCVIYGGFCILWGVYYSVSDSVQIFGIEVDGVEHSDLIAVDKMFVDIANEYSTQVTRDGNGKYIMNEDDIYTHSLQIYDSLEQEFPKLQAVAHKPKKIYFSKIMSYMDFTGFFFPFTGEANINTDFPQTMVPATIAHEMAHQRGVAAEDEANFTAVLACIYDDNPDYIYSGSLLALKYLQNALYKSGDKESWQAIRDTYTDEVVYDLAQDREYWKKYQDNPVGNVSNSTYDAFLKSYDQQLGRETYGACVDLLVEYFK